MTLRQDWNTYLSDFRAFDAEHFERLLFEDDLYAAPDALFGSLPAGKTIVSRISELVSDWKLQNYYFVPTGQVDEATQLTRVASYISELASLGEDEGLVEDAAALKNAPVEVLKDRDQFQALFADFSLNRTEIPDLLFDIASELMNARDPRLFGAYEAIQGLTTRPEVTNWIISDSLSFPISMRPAYLFYRDGGKVFLGLNKVYVYLA